LDHTILFVTDLHGSNVCLKKALNGAKMYKANSLIIGGDITGKFVVPVIKGPNGFTTEFQGTKYAVKKEDELKEIYRIIDDSGHYHYPTSVEELEEARHSKEKTEAIFHDLVIKRLGEWLKLIEERMKGTGIDVYITGGNDDFYSVTDLLKESKAIINPEDRVVDVGGHEMLSSGYSNITPWKCPRDIPEEEIDKKLEEMTGQLKDPKSSIFNIHVPPYDTPIDLAPELDATLRPKMSGSEGGFKMRHVGSTSVRKVIDKYQPLLGLHGHIHESRAAVKLGRTTCINPGSEYGEGVLRGVLITLAPDKVVDYTFFSG
jgi:Icc-related predicted phosphoesterase